MKKLMAVLVVVLLVCGCSVSQEVQEWDQFLNKINNLTADEISMIADGSFVDVTLTVTGVSIVDGQPHFKDVHYRRDFNVPGAY